VSIENMDNTRDLIDVPDERSDDLASDDASSIDSQEFTISALQSLDSIADSLSKIAVYLQQLVKQKA
jgi:hypothetical protein